MKHNKYYLDETRKLLESLKYKCFKSDFNPNMENWFPTNKTPRLPWENTHPDDMSVGLPLRTEASDFYRILMGSMVSLHDRYAWCSPETTKLAVEFWNEHHQ